MRTSDAPKQVRVFLLAGFDNVAVGNNHGDLLKIIDTQAIQTGEIALPPSENKASNSSVAYHSARGREAMLERRRVEVRPQGPALSICETFLGINRDLPEAGKID